MVGVRPELKHLVTDQVLDILLFSFPAEPGGNIAAVYFGPRFLLN